MTLFENKKSAIENLNGAIQLLKHVCILKKKKNLRVNSKLFKEVLVFRALGITSKKQDRSFIEDLLHHFHFWAF